MQWFRSSTPAIVPWLLSLLGTSLACSAAPPPTAARPASASAGATGAASAGTGGFRDGGAPRDAGFTDAAREIVSGIECPRPVVTDYTIKLGYLCTRRQDLSMIQDCVTQLECMSPADCTARPFGICVGAASSLCAYPVPEGPCTTDADCNALPDGRCLGSKGTETRCYPSGECKAVGSICHYKAFQTVCESDADCSAAPSGHCEQIIHSTHCEYDGCLVDSDCGRGKACACTGAHRTLACFNAECKVDSDCPRDQQCKRDRPCGWDAIGDFHCTTNADECRGDQDCPSGFCGFSPNLLRWACSNAFCTIP